MARHTHIGPVPDGNAHLIETWRHSNHAFRAVVHVDDCYPYQGYATLSMWGVGGWNELVRVSGQEIKERDGLLSVVSAMEAEAIDLLGWPGPKEMPR